MAGVVRNIQIEGTDLRITIWQGGDVTFQRRYKDKTGEWKNTNYLKGAHLMILKAIMDKVIQMSLDEAKNKKQEQQSAQAPLPDMPTGAPATEQDDDDIPF